MWKSFMLQDSGHFFTLLNLLYYETLTLTLTLAFYSDELLRCSAPSAQCASLFLKSPPVQVPL